MRLSLYVLAKTDFYKIIPQYETLFSELDNIHIPGDNNHYTCKSFERAYIQESFKPQLKKILNILERNDVKIIKVLYDHIFYFNNMESDFNALGKIKKCEYCNNLKNYVRITFKQFPILCTVGSSYSLCREYNDHIKESIKLEELSNLSCENGAKVYHCSLHSKLQQPSAGGMAPVGESKDVISRKQEDVPTHAFAEINEVNKLDIKNVIGGGITNKWKNTQKEKEVLLIRDSETESINFDNIQYNIACNPI
ncbi:PIR Superfamily Protein [Plasmodium ovale curtisi]|uniref:PIR Superfamily Protein n=1 Tax=Plasmodium ovale curtisi TaxID=864141 RepID=A0A1A8X7M4_PLAOA|nr:PIR Superfamily Protein [Plasmodium ovale curtisi]